MKRLLVCLLLAGVVGCGESEQTQKQPSGQSQQVAQQPSGESQQESSPDGAQRNANLAACPDCAGMVSKRAATCPHCGAPLEKMEPVDDAGMAAPELDPEVPEDGDPPVAPPEQLNPPAVDNGTLKKKLLTVRAVTSLRSQPTKSSKVFYVSSFNIFNYLEPVSDKDEAAGFYRVGNAAGEQLGWLQKKDVVFWNTRCAIVPKRLSKDDTFRVESEDTVVLYDPENIPGDAVVLALIKGRPNGEIFPVSLTVTRVAGSGARELNRISDLGLDIVFVIEDAGYLKRISGDGTTVMTGLKEFASDLMRSVQDNVDDINESPIRFGLIVYQDTNNEALVRRPVIRQALTSDLEQWRGQIEMLRGKSIGGDIPNDGISALSLAIDSGEVGWTVNSSKHIVLVGASPLQLHGRMEGPFFLGDRKELVFQKDWDLLFGFNSSGKTIRDLHVMASPTCSTIGNRLRQAINLHAIYLGLIGEDIHGPGVVSAADKLWTALHEIEKTKGRMVALRVFTQLNPNQKGQVMLADHIRKKEVNQAVAMSQYRSLINEQGEFYLAVAKADNRALNDLKAHLTAAIKTTVQLQKGIGDNIGVQRGGFSRSIYRLVGTAIRTDEIISQPVFTGEARVVSEVSGNRVGQEVILVSQEELRRFVVVVGQILENVTSRRARADRLDVSELMNRLKTALASLIAGEDIKDRFQLEAIIAELPLQTETLRMTANDIAVMDLETFDSWLESFSRCIKVGKIILDGDKGRWISVSGPNSTTTRWALFRLSDLP